MDQETRLKRWPEIERLYQSALELEPAKRGVYLKEACVGDEPLQEEVEDLLAQQSAAEAFLRTPAMDFAARVLAADHEVAPFEDLVGQSVAHYRIEEKIGEGGMGVVRSGSRQIWKIPAAGGNAIQVTRGGGIEGWETSDGKTFYFADGFADGGRRGVWTMPVDGGEEKQAIVDARAGCWAMADAGIYFIGSVLDRSGYSKTPALFFFDFSTRQVRQLLLITGRMRSTTDQTLTVTRDGRRIAWPQIDRDEADLMQIENFR